MIKKIFNIINKCWQLFTDTAYYSTSYSQEGEDMILRKYFEGQGQGFFVDVGAHHPKRFSNTYFFYRTGWSGINIDAMPGSMSAFNRTRKRDINLEKAVASVNKDLIYYVFDEPAINGFSEEISIDRNENTRYKIINKIEIRTETLGSILDKYLPENVKTIDFMSVDVEGLDLDVLKSNNWEKFRPQVILVELLNFESFDSDPVFLFLISKGYKFQAKSFYTFFFCDSINK